MRRIWLRYRGIVFILLATKFFDSKFATFHTWRRFSFSDLSSRHRRASAVLSGGRARVVQFSIQRRCFEKLVDVEPCAPSRVLDVFARAGAKQIVSEGAQPRGNVGVLADTRRVLGEGCVADVMAAVLDKPVPADPRSTALAKSPTPRRPRRRSRNRASKVRSRDCAEGSCAPTAPPTGATWGHPSNYRRGLPGRRR